MENLCFCTRSARFLSSNSAKLAHLSGFHLGTDIALWPSTEAAITILAVSQHRQLVILSTGKTDFAICGGAGEWFALGIGGNNPFCAERCHGRWLQLQGGFGPG